MNGKLTNTIKSPGSLTLGADLDNLSVGVYQITGVKINVSGTTVTVWGTIIVCRRAFDYQQVILSNGTKAIYYRSKNESEAWTEWKQLITNTDLQNYPKTIQFNIPIGSHVIIKEGDNRFAQLLFLQASNMNGQGIYGLSGYGEGGSRYFVSNISSNDSINIEIIGTTFKITNNFSNIVVATLTKFMGDTPTIQ